MSSSYSTSSSYGIEKPITCVLLSVPVKFVIWLLYSAILTENQPLTNSARFAINAVIKSNRVNPTVANIIPRIKYNIRTNSFEDFYSYYY
mgnify:FL=1